MLMIVAHHYVVNSGLTAVDGPLRTAPLAAKFVRDVGKDRHQLLSDDYRLFYVHKQDYCKEVLEIISVDSVLRNSHKWHISSYGAAGVFALVAARVLPFPKYS